MPPKKIFVLLSCLLFIVISGFDSMEGVNNPTESPPSELQRNNLIHFSGYNWEVKNSGSDKWGPGPNLWSNSTENVWVDSNGKLHLKITNRNGVWYSAEVVNTKTLGYGTYRFYVEGRPDLLDPNVVLGLFTYDGVSEDAEQNNYREMDIEFIKWGDPLANNLSYTVQPYTEKENISGIKTKLNGTYSTHSFTWTPQKIDFLSLHGHRSVPQKGSVIHSWSYQGEYIPNSQNEKVDINLWLYQGNPPMNQKEVELVISKFEFIPFSK